MPRPEPQPRTLLRAPTGCARLEWIQLWAGADCEMEWFDIVESGIGAEPIPGARLAAFPAELRAEASMEEVRLRAVLRVEHALGCRLQLRGALAPASSVVVRDAFGCDVLQAVEGSPALQLDLSVGRFSVDAVLTPGSSIAVELLRGATRRARSKSA